MDSRLSRRIIGIAAILLLLAAMLSPQPASLAQGEPASPPNVFSGYVRRCPATTTGIPNVTVRLQYQDTYYGTWNQVATAVTNATGYYELQHAPGVGAANYRIVETDPAGYTSCNAVPGAGGTKVDNNTIQYTGLMLIGTYDGNIFYDQPPNQAPVVTSITPVNGSSAAGALRTFTLVATDANSASDIKSLDLEVDDACGWPDANAIYLFLQPAANRIYLKKDDGAASLEGILPGEWMYGTGTLENSQVILQLDKTRYLRDGNTLTLEVGLRFKASYAGTWKLCGHASDWAGASHTKDLGNWTVTTGPTPTPTPTRTPTPAPGPRLRIEISGQQMPPSGAGAALADQGANISDTVRVMVTAVNTGDVALSRVIVDVTYNTTCWDYRRSEPGTSPEDPADDGSLRFEWVYFGTPLQPGDTDTFWVEFHAVRACADTRICARGVGVDATMRESPAHQACLTYDIGQARLSVQLRVVEVRAVGFATLGEGKSSVGPLAGARPLAPDTNAAVGDVIHLAFTVTNTGQHALEELTASFSFEAACFQELATVPPRDGVIVGVGVFWNDLTATLGDVPPGGSITADIWLRVIAPCDPTTTCAEVHGLDAQKNHLPSVYACETFHLSYGLWASVWHDRFPPYGFPPQAWEQPLAGARVELRGPAGFLLDHAYSDPFGLVRLRGVRPQLQYTVREINPPGFAIDSTPNEYPYQHDPQVAQLIMFGDRRAPRLEVDIGPYLEACISDTITIIISVTNRSDLPVERAAVELTYNTAHLRYLGVASLPSDDNVNDGRINWSDIYPGLGGPHPEVTTVMWAQFHVESAAEFSGLCVSASGVDVGANAIPRAERCRAISLFAPGGAPCQELLVNGGFETGWVEYIAGQSWSVGCPEPLGGISHAEHHSGGAAWCMGGIVEGCRSVSIILRQITLPASARSAVLSFWYRINDPAWEGGGAGGPPDRLYAELYDALWGSVIQTILPPTWGTQGWTRVQADVSALAGQTFWLRITLEQDGQADSPPPTACIDDISLCTYTCGPPRDGPDGPGAPFCWKDGGYVDYAPSGMPDFDQRQADLRVGEQWTHDGPVALTNCLWWFDSKFEPGTTPPPAVSDGYPLLVGASGDDHVPGNVLGVVRNLAGRADTNGQRTQQQRLGTAVEDLRIAAFTLLRDRGLQQDYTVALRSAPEFDWVRAEVNRSEDVILLLGFWENQAGTWRRLGGHYVTSAGVSCADPRAGPDERIAIADPFLNRAEEGWPGRALPAGPHNHTGLTPDTLHNDAQNVSHDIYQAMPVSVPGASWGLSGYAPRYEEIANFLGMNVQPGQESHQASAYGGGTIVAAVEYALAISPVEPGVSIRVEPELREVAAGEVFTVSLRVDAPGGVDKVFASLGFNPAYLQVVAANGQPASSVQWGSTFPERLLNVVDPTNGYIDLVTAQRDSPATGSFALATVRFKALADTSGATTSLVFRQEAEHLTAAFLNTLPVLTRQDGGQVSIGASSARLSATVTLQGRPAKPHAAWRVPLELILYEPGSAVPVRVEAVQTDDRGRFVVAGIAPGSYDLRVKGAHTLANLRRGVTLASGDNSVALGTLLEGDANNDNRVSLPDVSLLAMSWGRSTGQAGFDPACDLNGDGVVNAADQALLTANYGRSGDVALNAETRLAGLPFGAQSSVNGAAAQPAATTGVELRLAPAGRTAQVGEVFQAFIEVGAGAQRVDSVQAYIVFDPTRLQVVNASGAPVTSIAAPGPMTVLLNQVDNAAGLISLARMIPSDNAITGNQVVGSFYLKAIAPAQAGSYLTFALQGALTTDLRYRGASVLGALAGSRIAIPGLYPVALPALIKEYRR